MTGSRFGQWLLALTALLACTATHADQDLVGVWHLVAYTAEDPGTGNIIAPFGEHPTGFIFYTAGGRMAAVISAGDRPHFTAGNRINAPEGERAAAFSSSTAYSGTYTVEGESVTHHVEVSTNPDWVGSHQKRFPRLEGRRLTITTPPLPTRPDGKLRVSRLVWERAE